jgi:hypothetical protein
MAVVVRCTGCNGLAQVGPEAVGLLVVCPRCRDPFLADPVPFDVPAAPPPAPPPPPRPVRAEPVAPPRPRRRRRAEPEPDPHDHPPPTGGGVPFSVIVGLALLPLSIPLLWLIGPELTGIAPPATLATPASLAVSMAVLCLAVAFTEDWSAATRIKGVLTLVGLAYFGGLVMYFAKKEALEFVQQRLGGEQRWDEVKPPGEGFEARLPDPAASVENEPLPGMKGRRGVVQRFGGLVKCSVGSAADADPDLPDRERFDDLLAALLKQAPGRVVKTGFIMHRDRYPGCEWEIRHGREDKTVRLVRVFRANGRLFAAAAEGPNLDADSDDARKLFASFHILDGR